MELVTKKGYKQTEVGMIPEEWVVTPLSEAVDFLDGKRRPIKSSERISGDYPYYGASGIIDYVNDYIFDDELILLGEDGENILSRNLPLAFIVKGKAWVNNHAHVLKPKNDFNIYFLTEFLESLDYSLLNSGTAQPKLNKQSCLNIKVPKPPLAEQKAIATALSEVDALITSLDQLIQKKEAIKQGAMQELLTGKTRLQGFEGSGRFKQTEVGRIPEEWEVKSYGDIFDFLTTASFSRAQLIPSGEVLCVHYGDIHTKFNHFIDFANAEMNGCSLDKGKKYPFLKNGDVIMADASEDYIGIGKSIEVKNLSKDAISGLHTFLLRDRNRCFADGFRSYIHLMPPVKNSLEKLATGLKVFGISKSNLMSILIPIPSIPEQKIIAKILSGMDDEIAHLQNKKAKYEQIKQGMMQELLTGKTRLI